MNKTKMDVCEISLTDQDKVNHVKESFCMASLPKALAIFKALGDETRLKIVYGLTVEEELCVCDLAEVTGCSIASASHHIRYLYQLDIVSSRKEGKLVYYSLKNPDVKQLVLFALGVIGKEETP